MKQYSFRRVGTSILFPSNTPVLLMLNINRYQGRMVTILRESTEQDGLLGVGFAVDSGCKCDCRSRDTGDSILSWWGSVWWQGNRTARLGHSRQAMGSMQLNTCSEIKGCDIKGTPKFTPRISRPESSLKYRRKEGCGISPGMHRGRLSLALTQRDTETTTTTTTLLRSFQRRILSNSSFLG